MAIIGATGGSPFLSPVNSSPPFPSPGEDEYQKACDFKKAGNLPQAFFSYQSAAEKSHAEAQYQLARCYKMGEGIAIDEKKAEEWYRKAAVEGHASAQHRLGTCYYKGLGVIKDEKEAVSWYRKAADQGFALA